MRKDTRKFRGRPIAAETKLARAIAKRRMTYAGVAEAITRAGYPVSVSTISTVARGASTSRALAEILIAWVNNPRDLRLSDLRWLGDGRKAG